MPEKEKKPEFVVTDRRLFSAEGELRQDVVEDEERRAEREREKREAQQRTNDERAAQRNLADGGRNRRCRRGGNLFRIHNYLIDRSFGVQADSDRALSVSGQPMGNVLFEHDVEVGASKTEGANPGTPRNVGRNHPRLQFGVDVEG